MLPLCLTSPQLLKYASIEKERMTERKELERKNEHLSHFFKCVHAFAYACVRGLCVCVCVCVEGERKLKTNLGNDARQTQLLDTCYMELQVASLCQLTTLHD